MFCFYHILYTLSMVQRPITVKGVRVHNLQNVDVTLPAQSFVVLTGVSGSGKSSFAFDTLFNEGQRRYIESLSSSARQSVGEMKRPDVDSIDGLSPTISIEQKSVGRNIRSTVATMTEIYDFLRVLYARVGIPHCPVSGEAVLPQSRDRIIKTIQGYTHGKKLLILAPWIRRKKGEFKEDMKDLLRKGFMRVRVDGTVYDIEGSHRLDSAVAHDIDVVIDRLVVNTAADSRIAEAVSSALELTKSSVLVVDVDGGKETLFSSQAFSPQSGLSYPALEPTDFSYNSPHGMCPKCQGLGTIDEYQEDLVIDPDLSIAEDCCKVGSSYQTVRFGNICDNLARLYRFEVNTPWKNLPETAKKVFLYGTKSKWTPMTFVHPVTGAVWQESVAWRGMLAEAHKRYAQAESDVYRKNQEKYLHKKVCDVCHGARLKPYPAATTLGGKKIHEISRMPVGQALRFFEALTLPPQESHIAAELLKEIQRRLRFLVDVGLDYLALDRTAPTLSGGEGQRVRLAAQLGCGLVGVTYILDEPSIGLHPRDNKKLIDTLQQLKDKGNTVIVVEHDEDTMLAADHVVDFGPLAGIGGGKVVAEGTLQDILKSKRSVTGQYLCGKEAIEIPTCRRDAKGFLQIRGARHHNLKNIDVKIPLGVFVAVTGVSGSGKSSLIGDILHPALARELHGAESLPGEHESITGIEHVDKVICIDQSPIGKNPRSNPATYIKLLDDIRNLFVELPDAKARGYKPGRFSFNVKEGSCPHCHGMGQVKVDMDFLDDAWIDCSVCNNKRFDDETLSILYKGKSIHDILEMEVLEALSFFENIPTIRRKLEILAKVGLDYLELGQASPTLSGGESQRVKLARELVHPSTGRTLYILDEPTTGLHFHDIKHLLAILHEFVDAGNTVVVIEHNMEVVKTADWIIDLGPGGGDDGGTVVGAGTPEQLSELATPTGEAVKDSLQCRRSSRVKPGYRKNKKPICPYLKDITIVGAEQNNLKKISLQLPRDKMTILTGPSGSGKSSLALDTLFAEGQRRYASALSPYARQFVKQAPKPKVDDIEGLSPAVAIEQKVHAGNPRSTVGTLTEVYDYLRLLFARLGVPHCPDTGFVIENIDAGTVADCMGKLGAGEKVVVMAPVEVRRHEAFEDVVQRYQKAGFLRFYLNGAFFQVEDAVPAFEKRKKNNFCVVVDRVVIGKASRSRLVESVETAARLAQDKVVLFYQEKEHLYNLSFAVAKTGKSYPMVTPNTFSFNRPEGWCPDCLGIGVEYGADLCGNTEFSNKLVYSLLNSLWMDNGSYAVMRTTEKLLKNAGIDVKMRLKDLSPQQRHFLMKGSDSYVEVGGALLRWVGIDNVLAKLGKAGLKAYSDQVMPLLNSHPCPSCHGSRLNPLACHVTIDGKSIAEVCKKPLPELLAFMKKLSREHGDKKLLKDLFKEILGRLQFLCDVGLEYITLDRSAPTLSGGETQRIHLARQLGSNLTGVLYILDEPSIGLHPHDNVLLQKALKKLKDLGNTLLIVEHDPLTIAAADHVVDFGPAAGAHGGHVVATGTVEEICRNPKSLTGAYLSGDKAVGIPEKRRPGCGKTLAVENACLHNLKGIALEFPVGAMSCLTGVSGSGKSSLMHDVIAAAVTRGLKTSDKVVLEGAVVAGIKNFTRLCVVDQDPIGRTIRADVATYTDVLTPLRQFFAMLQMALTRGLQAKHFSYNSLHGMCMSCFGMGYKKIDLRFLPAVEVECPECHGLRLNQRALEVTYLGKNLGQYLDCTVEEIRRLFENHPAITRVLDTVIAVGLGYLRLGQRMATLSGGEAQRLKLSHELSRPSTGKTLYLLDEPTTGLHSDDVAKLMKVLHALVDKGNTMILIEHNVDVIKNADYVVDLGPGAGPDGGNVVATGTPEEIRDHPESVTAKFLK